MLRVPLLLVLALGPDPAALGQPAPSDPRELTAARPPLPPPPPPPSGAGRLVGGSLAIALGLAATSVVFAESARAGGNPRFAAATFIPLGLTGIGVGTYLLVRGVKARQNLRGWIDYTGYEPLATGDGLLVAGVMSTLAGGVTLVAAGASAREPGALERPLTPSLLAIGGTGVAIGIGALIGGGLQRRKYRAWRQATFLSIGRVTPTVAPLITRTPDPSSEGTMQVHGASVGVYAAF